MSQVSYSAGTFTWFAVVGATGYAYKIGTTGEWIDVGNVLSVRIPDISDPSDVHWRVNSPWIGVPREFTYLHFDLHADNQNPIDSIAFKEQSPESLIVYDTTEDSFFIYDIATGNLLSQVDWNVSSIRDGIEYTFRNNTGEYWSISRRVERRSAPFLTSYHFSVQKRTGSTASDATEFYRSPSSSFLLGSNIYFAESSLPIQGSGVGPVFFSVSKQFVTVSILSRIHGINISTNQKYNVLLAITGFSEALGIAYIEGTNVYVTLRDESVDPIQRVIWLSLIHI